MNQLAAYLADTLAFYVWQRDTPLYYTRHEPTRPPMVDTHTLHTFLNVAHLSYTWARDYRQIIWRALRQESDKLSVSAIPYTLVYKGVTSSYQGLPVHHVSCVPKREDGYHKQMDRWFLCASPVQVAP